MSRLPARLHRPRPLLVALLPLLPLLSPAHADEGGRLESITATGSQDSLPRVGAALAEAPTPQSRLDQEAIRELAAPTGDYGTLLKLTPSYLDSAPNGEGFDAAKNQTLRGFADGQFNLTVDGIPVQDPDNFQHHSTSYFPAPTLDHLVVDRSPGGAGDPGYATVGGTIQLSTLALPEHDDGQVYGSVGSFATSVVGAHLSTAAPKQPGAGGVLIDVEHRQTAGALSNSDGRRDDVMLKSEWLPLADLRITGLLSFDRYHYNNPPSVSQAQFARQGPSYGYGATPGQVDYYGLSATDRRADFGYLRFDLDAGSGWRLDDRLYEYGYANRGLGLQGDTTSSPIGNGKGVPASDFALYRTNEDYTTVGNLLTVSRQDTSGTARAGLWVEHSREEYLRDTVDGTTGQPYNGARNHTPIYARFTSHLDTVQPWAEYAWQASEYLTLRPGLRWQQVRRGLDAAVLQKTAIGTPGEVSRTVSTTLPSLDLNLRLDPATHLLAEVAKGVQVPNQAFFYTTTPVASNQAAPQTSVAWQVGVVREQGGTNLGLTAYVIHFDNYIATTTSNNVTVSQNSGSVLYRGLELEAHSALGQGWGLLGNASLIRAEYQQAGLANPAQKAGDDVSLVPSYLALCGVLYRNGPWQGSLLVHLVGAEYQGSGGSSNPAQRVDPYHYADLTLSRFLGPLAGLEGARISLQIGNLQGQTPITDNGGLSKIAADGYQINTLPVRNYTLSLVGDF